MHKFEFLSVVRIIVERGGLARIGPLAADLGSRILIIHAGPLSPGAPAGRLADLLAAAGLTPIFIHQHGEPAVADVDAAVSTARAARCDALIGLGGGSALDCAKAVAALLANGGSALDYLEVIGQGKKITRPALPWIAIPTTAGTGAEVTRNAVIASPENKFKASIRSEHLLPRLALIDAQLAADVPAPVAARAGMDALCQLIESYTSTNANPITDALALQGLALAARSLRRACTTPDLDAREDMAVAALLSGLTLANAGLGAAHGFAAALGAAFPIHHGTICAVMLPLVIQANINALQSSPGHPALARYAAVGRILADQPSLPDAAARQAAVDRTAALVRDLNIPRLGACGLAESDIPAVVSTARRSSSMRYNPVILPDDALTAILRAAIGP